MVEILLSSSSERSSGCDSDSGSSSRNSSSSKELPPLDVPGVNIDVVYKGLRVRVVSRLSACSSTTPTVPPIVSSTFQEVDDEMVCYAVGVLSSINVDRLLSMPHC